MDMTNFAVCAICPGNAKIYPASALDRHMLDAHTSAGSDNVKLCCDCNKPNESYGTSRRCAKCRHRGKRSVGIRRRQMSSTGVEKSDSVKRLYGVVK